MASTLSIRISTEAGDTAVVDGVSLESKVIEIKRMVARQLKIPPICQRLLLDEKVLLPQLRSERVDAASRTIANAEVSLDVIEKKDLDELQNVASPPEGVHDVFEAVLHLQAGLVSNIEVNENGQAKDTSWIGIQKMTRDPSVFLRNLRSNFKRLIDEGLLPQKNLTFAQGALSRNPGACSVESMRKVSVAAAGVYEWLNHMLEYSSLTHQCKTTCFELEDSEVLATCLNEITDVTLSLITTNRHILTSAFFSSHIEHPRTPLDDTREIKTRLAQLACLEEALSSEKPGWRDEEARAYIQRAVRRSEAACHVITSECDTALSDAMPALERSLHGLSRLTRRDQGELHGIKCPTAGMVLSLKALCIMLEIRPLKIAAPDGRGKVDDYWFAAKKEFVHNPNLIPSLVNFDMESITQATVRRVEPIFDDPCFHYDHVRKASLFCAEICRWVRAAVAYARVVQSIAPLRDKLRQAQLAVSEAQENAKLEYALLSVRCDLAEPLAAPSTKEELEAREQQAYFASIKAITVQVCTLSGDIAAQAERSPFDTVFDVRRIIADQAHLPLCCQQMIFEYTPISDNAMLFDCIALSASEVSKSIELHLQPHVSMTVLKHLDRFWMALNCPSGHGIPWSEAVDALRMLSVGDPLWEATAVLLGTFDFGVQSRDEFFGSLRSEVVKVLSSRLQESGELSEQQVSVLFRYVDSLRLEKSAAESSAVVAVLQRLIQCDATCVIPVLECMLLHADQTVRIRAMDAFSNIREGDLTQRLIKLFKSRKADEAHIFLVIDNLRTLRSNQHRGVSDCLDDSVMQAMLSAMLAKKTTRSVWSAVADLAVQLTPLGVEDERILGVVATRAEQGFHPALDFLIQAAGKGSKACAMHIVSAVLALPPEKKLVTLETLLQLGSDGYGLLADAISSCIEDRDAELRIRCLELIAKLPETIIHDSTALKAKLADDWPHVRRIAGEMLS